MDQSNTGVNLGIDTVRPAVLTIDVHRGHFVPPPPRRIVDPRPGVANHCSSQDVYVDRDGLMYLTDYTCGLYVLEYTG